MSLKLLRTDTRVTKKNDSLDVIVIDVVEDSHAGLHALVDVELGVVGLWDVAALQVGLVAGEGPGLVGPAGRGRVGGGHLNAGARPEPTVHLEKERLESEQNIGTSSFNVKSWLLCY